ncbi:hypothetical protein FMUAM8_02070 [Nocardia cyriacigeorgica]|nr:hypothetical protein FMUAM8_02070 [Nocardia cyriacigeorgica]
MNTLSPQGALLMLCISRLPDRTIPRQSWAAEVLVELLWECMDQAQRDAWGNVVLPLVNEYGVNPRRIRAEVWGLAQAGALIPAGVGTSARFEASEEFCSDTTFNFATAERDRAIDLAVSQLTARLFALSNTARA